MNSDSLNRIGGVFCDEKSKDKFVDIGLEYCGDTDLCQLSG